VVDPAQRGDYPAAITSSAQRSLFDNLDRNEALALKLDEAILQTRQDSWRGHLMKERKLLKAIAKVLDASSDGGDPKAILELAKHQDEY
jgi:type I restriction enzyme R subunit